MLPTKNVFPSHKTVEFEKISNAPPSPLAVLFTKDVSPVHETIEFELMDKSIIATVDVIVVVVAFSVVNLMKLPGAIVMVPHNTSREEHEHEGNKEGESDNHFYLFKRTHGEKRWDHFDRYTNHFIYSDRIWVAGSQFPLFRSIQYPPMI